MNAANLMMVNVQTADAAVRAGASSGKTAAKSEGFGGGKQQKAFEELFAQAKTEAEAPLPEESPDVAAQQAAGFNPLAALVELTARPMLSPEIEAAGGARVDAVREAPIAAAGGAADDFALALKTRLTAAEQTPDAAAQAGEAPAESARGGAARLLIPQTDDAASQAVVSPRLAEQPVLGNATPTAVKQSGGLNLAEAALEPPADGAAFPERAAEQLFSATTAADGLTARPSQILPTARPAADVIPDANVASEPVRAAAANPVARTDGEAAPVAPLARAIAAEPMTEPLPAATSRAAAETLLRLLDGQTASAAVSLTARQTAGKTAVWAAENAEHLEVAAKRGEAAAELLTDGAEVSAEAPRQDAARRGVSFDARQPQPNLNAAASGAAETPNGAGESEASDAARSLEPAFAERTAQQPKLTAKPPASAPFRSAKPAADAAETKQPAAQPILAAGPANANAAAAADRAEAAASAPRAAAQYNIAEQIVEKAHLIKTDQDTQMIIKLKPEHLGELSLKITVENGAVSASFHSDNAQVRAALETSLLQLKQELAAQGVKVDNVGVYAGMGDLMSNGQGGQAGREQQSARYKNRKIDLADFEDEVDKVGIVAENKANEDGVDYRI